jgi:hypothetical protein
MYALIAAALLLIILGIGYLGSLNSKIVSSNASVSLHQTTAVASMGAQIFAGCENMPTGTYSSSSITGLPAGYPTTTPVGNSWVCEVATGGPYGSAHLIAWASAPQYLGEKTQSLIQPGGQQANEIAYGTAANLYQYFKNQPNILVGVVPAGTTTLDLINSYLTINMSGMISPQPYDTPVVVSGLSP